MKRRKLVLAPLFRFWDTNAAGFLVGSVLALVIADQESFLPPQLKPTLVASRAIVTGEQVSPSNYRVVFVPKSCAGDIPRNGRFVQDSPWAAHFITQGSLITEASLSGEPSGYSDRRLAQFSVAGGVNLCGLLSGGDPVMLELKCQDGNDALEIGVTLVVDCTAAAVDADDSVRREASGDVGHGGDQLRLVFDIVEWDMVRGGIERGCLIRGEARRRVPAQAFRRALNDGGVHGW